MYLRNYGLKLPPFSIAPDPRFLFMSERHREALAHLRYGLGAGGGGFVVLTGEIGAGKTTVCRCLLEQVPPRCNLAYLFNPKLTARELMLSVCTEFGLEVAAAQGDQASIKDCVDALNTFLLSAHAAGEHNVLIIDEAQRLSLELLEQLRLLTNLETSRHKLLQIVLIGQPELRDMLRRPELEPLAQRVVARFHLGTLSRAETVQYIHHRLAVAGMGPVIPFDAAALRRIHHHSRGVPRRINLLCDRALLGGYAEGKVRIRRRMVDQAAREAFESEPSRWWRVGAPVGWLAGGAAMAVGVLALGTWVGGANRTQVPVAATSLPVAAAPATAASTAPSASVPDPPAVVPPPVVAAQTMIDADEIAALLADAPRDEAQAWRQLASAWQVDLASAAPCEALRARALHCLKRRGGLGLLRDLQRPAILPLYGADGAARYAVLEGLSDSAARLRLGPHQARVDLTTLASLWRDEFGLLWRAPPGTRINADGAIQSIDPAWLAAQLARTRGAAAMAGDRLPSVREQVRTFQRSRGLDADGQVGAMTLMQLQAAAGSADGPRLQD